MLFAFGFSIAPYRSLVNPRVETRGDLGTARCCVSGRFGVEVVDVKAKAALQALAGRQHGHANINHFDDRASHMMHALEQIQDTLARLVALYPESLSDADFENAAMTGVSDGG